MACIACRTCVWLYWLALALVTGCYAALSLVSFSNVYKAYDDGGKDNEALRAILATTIFGSFLVGAYAIFSFFILLGKTMMATGAGFGYGLLLSSSLHMAITSLLCGLVMHGFEDEVENELEEDSSLDWGGGDTSTYEATWSFAYISAGVYMMFAVWLFFGMGAFRKEEENKKKPGASEVAGSA